MTLEIWQEPHFFFICSPEDCGALLSIIYTYPYILCHIQGALS
jgi:hypothetical protein